jgi:hypothetical protein
VFQGFSKAKSANGGSILSSSQFLILPQLPQKIKLASKVVKVDSKIVISLPKIYIPETHCRTVKMVFLGRLARNKSKQIWFCPAKGDANISTY